MKNSGNEIASRVETEMPRSKTVPCRIAATSPRQIASGTAIIAATAASSRVFSRRKPIWSATGRRLVSDMPRSPCRKPPSHEM